MNYPTKRQLLYFSIAFLTALLINEKPLDWWDIFKWVSNATLQGLIALKALDSAPGEQERFVDHNQAALQSVAHLEELAKDDAIARPPGE